MAPLQAATGSMSKQCARPLKRTHIDLTQPNASSKTVAKHTSAKAFSATEAASVSGPATKKLKIEKLKRETLPTTGEQPMSTNVADAKDEPDAFSSMLAGSLVTLYVGPMRKEYIIHQKLICSAADIFKTHFETLDTKAPVIDMHLPNHDPKAFGLFIDFLYRKTFSEVLPPTSQELSTAEMDSKKHPHEDNIDLLLNLYFMACDWGMLDLQNLSLDHTVRYLRKANDLFQRKHLVAIYGKIRAPKSPLRRFAVDHFIHANLKRSVPIRQRQKSIRERIDVDSSNFILDVFEAMLHAKRCPAPMDPMSQSKCVYHVHSDGVDCTK